MSYDSGRDCYQCRFSVLDGDKERPKVWCSAKRAWQHSTLVCTLFESFREGEPPPQGAPNAHEFLEVHDIYSGRRILRRSDITDVEQVDYYVEWGFPGASKEAGAVLTVRKDAVWVKESYDKIREALCPGVVM